MPIQISIERLKEDLEKMIDESCYSGERIIICEEERAVALVPLEDLSILEEIERD